jgi:hypothetical protein
MIFYLTEFQNAGYSKFIFQREKTVLEPPQRGSQPQKSRFPAAEVFFRHFCGARSGR